MRAVNLLPRDAQPGGKSIRNEDPAVVVGSVLGLVVVIALAGGFLTAHSKANVEQKKLSAAQIQLGKLSLHKQSTVKVKTPVQTTPIIPVPAVTSEEQPRLAAITDAMSTRIAWDRILREFSLVVPDDVTISALTMTAPADATADATTASQGGLSLTGLAYSHDSVARLLSRLMLIPDLSNVTLSSSTATTTGASGVSFSINANVKGAVVPVAPAVTTAPTDTSSTTTGATS
jgi:Tfp pilus assembly protein PilN